MRPHPSLHNCFLQPLKEAWLLAMTWQHCRREGLDVRDYEQACRPQSALMCICVPGGGQPVMSVLRAHVHSLLKPLGLQHRLRGTSAPPKVARHTKALLTLENLPVGSSSCRQDQVLQTHGRVAAPCQLRYCHPTFPLAQRCFFSP